MLKYVLKRIGMAALTLLIIVFLLFWLVRVMPGNPFPSERMNDIQIANKRAELGLDNPILVQFWNYIVKLLHGDFGNGTSLYYGVPIKTVLSTAVSNSFRIGGIYAHGKGNCFHRREYVSVFHPESPGRQRQAPGRGGWRSLTATMSAWPRPRASTAGSW